MTSSKCLRSSIAVIKNSPAYIYSSSLCYAQTMLRFVLSLPCLLGACAAAPVVPASFATEVRPVVDKDDLRGRWKITAVNGRHVSGPWLQFGGEGLGTVTKTRNGIFIASPQPHTRAFLGCNDWQPNGWTRNGDKLTFGIEMAHRTERGCDPATMNLDDEAFAILNAPITMELTPPNGLRLINEKGTLNLFREGN